MKVKEVQYQRLFTLGSYNNERIGFVAEVDGEEDAGKVLGELFFKVLDVEDCLEAYRRLLEEQNRIELKAKTVQQRIASLEKHISEMKITVDELVEKIKTGDIDARLRHACETRSLKSLEEEKEENIKELKEITKEKNKIEKQLEVLRRNIKNGTFKLPKDLKLTKTDFEFY